MMNDEISASEAPVSDADLAKEKLAKIEAYRSALSRRLADLKASRSSAEDAHLQAPDE